MTRIFVILEQTYKIYLVLNWEGKERIRMMVLFVVGIIYNMVWLILCYASMYIYVYQHTVPHTYAGKIIPRDNNIVLLYIHIHVLELVTCGTWYWY